MTQFKWMHTNFTHETKIGMLQHDATIITLTGFYSTKLDIYIKQNNFSLFRQKRKGESNAWIWRISEKKFYTLKFRVLQFVTPDEAILPYSFKLTSTVSNNAAEYEALIIGLEIAHNMGLNQLLAYGDSQLIINQLLGTYTVKKKGSYRTLKGQKN